MKRLILFLLIPVIWMNCSLASKEQAMIDSANAAYIKGKYESAITNYENVLRTGQESAYLYYNLGNAYYKSNKLTLAILNYERAHVLAPEDEDINFNLDLARKHVVDKINVLPDFFINNWISNFTSFFSSDTWSVISIGSFITFLLLVSLYLFLRILLIRKIAFWLAVLFLLFSSITFLCSWQEKSVASKRNAALILSPVVNVKGSPDESGTDLFILHEGTKVTVKDSLSIWREVRMSDGNVGWIKASDMVYI